MVGTEYLRGFTDCAEMILLELKKAKDLEDARKRVEYILSAAVEKKIEELARRLGYPLSIY